MTVSRASELESALEGLRAPARICLKPGVYEGPFALRDGVDLKGVEDGAIVVGLDAEQAKVRGVTLTGLELQTLWAGGFGRPVAPIRLWIRESTLNDVRTTTAGTGRLEIDIEDGIVADQAILIEHEFGGARADVRIAVRRLHCETCYPLVRVQLTETSGATLPAGSRIDVDVANNLVTAAELESITAYVQAPLAPDDRAASRLWFRHNTLVNSLGANGLFASGDDIVIANNVIIDSSNPIHGGVSLQNLVGTLAEGADAWFTDYAGGDYTPSPSSPLLGAARLEQATSDDFLGNPRDAAPDVGAFERIE